MMSGNSKRLFMGMGARKWMYAIIMAAMVFTGFGQMPMYKRYYVSAIPGMEWSADYYVTLTIHYAGAVLLLAFVGYVIADYLFAGRRVFRITPSGYTRAAFLAGLAVTGVFRVLKNLPDYDFSAGFTMLVDISHMGFMMGYAVVSLVFWRLKSHWVAEKTA